MATDASEFEGTWQTKYGTDWFAGIQQFRIFQDEQGRWFAVLGGVEVPDKPFTEVIIANSPTDPGGVAGDTLVIGPVEFTLQVRQVGEDYYKDLVAMGKLVGTTSEDAAEPEVAGTWGSEDVRTGPPTEEQEEWSVRLVTAHG